MAPHNVQYIFYDGLLKNLRWYGCDIEAQMAIGSSRNVMSTLLADARPITVTSKHSSRSRTFDIDIPAVVASAGRRK